MQTLGLRDEFYPYGKSTQWSLISFDLGAAPATAGMWGDESLNMICIICVSCSPSSCIFLFASFKIQVATIRNRELQQGLLSWGQGPKRSGHPLCPRLLASSTGSRAARTQTGTHMGLSWSQLASWLDISQGWPCAYLVNQWMNEWMNEKFLKQEIQSYQQDHTLSEVSRGCVLVCRWITIICNKMWHAHCMSLCSNLRLLIILHHDPSLSRTTPSSL